MISQNKHGLLCLVAIVLCVCDVKAQIVSVQDGDWSSPTTWDGGIVPVYDNSISVVVDHNVVIPSGYTLSIDDVTVNGSLRVAENAAVTITNGGSPVDLFLSATGFLHVYGIIICSSGASLTGTNGSNTTFFDGSTYRHFPIDEGIIPLAIWYPQSTFEILGLTGNRTMQSLNWGQTFGNLIYDCPGQGEFIEFKALLKHIAGDFIIRNTNRYTLRLAQAQSLNLQIDGDVLIEGPSEIWFGMSANSIVSVGGNFTYNSTSTASSYFTTIGRTIFTVNGNFTMNAIWRLKLASSSASGHTDLIVKGDFQLDHGILDALNNESNTAGGTGTIIFDADGQQEVFVSKTSGTGFLGNMSFQIGQGSELNLGESLLSNTTSGSLQVNGKILLGSTNSTGVIQAGSSGNINVTGSLQFEPGSVLKLNGTEQQFMSYTNLGSAEVLIDNSAGVTLLSDIQSGGLTLANGNLNVGIYSYHVTNNVLFENGNFIGSGALMFNGSSEQTLSANGRIIQNLTVEKGVPSNVVIASPLHLTGLLSVLSVDSDIISNGNLTLVSSSELPEGTAQVGPLASGSSVVGNVIVQRFMAGVGDKYRYIGSPVDGATVQSLKNVVPVTGIFDDPSSGPGIISNAPSLFEYDEVASEWKPWPAAGLAAENYFEPGRGYCYFNWNNTASTIWNVNGTLNQSNIPFALTYSPKGNPSTDGWNLIANPYPSAIRWDSGPGWERNSSVSMGIAVRDNSINGFLYWDGGTGSLPEGRIALGQSFWVRASGPSPQLTIHESAKVTNGATFYRKRETLDYIELEVTVNDQSDKTFLRLREDAHEMLDNYDIPKLTNDNLSFSFLTADSVSVAINAMGKMPCHLEIPIKVLQAQPATGTTTFSLNAFGVLEGSAFHIYDKKTNEKIKLDTQGSAISLPATIKTLDGLQLIIDSPTPEEIEFSVPHFVCGQDSLKIELSYAQPGITYSLLHEDENFDLDFNPEKTSFRLSGKDLVEGFNSFQLMARSSCAEHVMDEPVETEKIILKTPEVQSDPVCQSGSVTFLSDTDSVMHFNWYGTEEDIVPLYSGTTFTTPHLSKPTTYFVAAVDSNGCIGDRIPVPAEILAYDSVTITLTDGHLISNYAEGNQWYFEGDPLPEGISQTLVPQEPGIYEVEVAIGSCQTRSLFNFVIADAEENVESNVQVYPNPCSNQLFIRFRKEINIELINVLSSYGIAVNYLCEDGYDDESYEINTVQWPSGLYTLCFKIADDLSFVRVIKR